MTLQLRRACSEDYSFARTQLESAGLPVSDLSAETLMFALDDGEHVQGVIGCEYYDDVALLRSLIVAEATRGQGAGAQLVATLESHSADNGVEEVWLLTIDAAPFFAKLDYVVRERADAPDAIRRTAEFSGLCPGDAVLMSKRL